MKVRKGGLTFGWLLLFGSFEGKWRAYQAGIVKVFSAEGAVVQTGKRSEQAQEKRIAFTLVVEEGGKFESQPVDLRKETPENKPKRKSKEKRANLNDREKAT